MFDGKYMHGGLTDRLRGMCSVYDFCKENSIPFYIYFTVPFNLNDYLVPNKYDWTINTEDIDPQNATIEIINDWEIPTALHKYYLMKLRYQSKKKQILLFSNTNFRDYKFRNNFNELFKPSTLLQNEIDKIIYSIKEKYITISLRFTTLLGDFEDCINKPLSKGEQENLINSCLKSIEEIYRISKYKKVVVTSDSITFLKRASKIPYVYIIDGEIGHIDYNNNNNNLKTFLDYFVISKAEEAFLILGRGMYKSGFSKHAALLGDIKFTEYYIK